jgi:hypothetical protein
MMPEEPVANGKVVLPAGVKAVAETPFGKDASVREVPADGLLPRFTEYLLLHVK